MHYSRDLRPAKRGLGLSLRSSNPKPLMSALGRKRTFSGVQRMSALPPKADIDGLRGPLAERFRQKLCRIPSIVRLMPFSSLVGLPMFTMRLERYFGSPC